MVCVLTIVSSARPMRSSQAGTAPPRTLTRYQRVPRGSLTSAVKDLWLRQAGGTAPGMSSQVEVAGLHACGKCLPLIWNESQLRPLRVFGVTDGDCAGQIPGDLDAGVFALITAETRRHGGDVAALNLVLITATDLWALRYPATHELYVLDRPAGRGEALDVASPRIHARSPHLADQPSVIIASERMDDDPGWRPLGPGELLHVSSALGISSSAPFPPEPAHLLRGSQLDAQTEASQHPEAAPS
jgi:hypothetical protein